MPLISRIEQYGRILTLEDFILESDKLYCNLSEEEKNLMLEKERAALNSHKVLLFSLTIERIQKIIKFLHTFNVGMVSA